MTILEVLMIFSTAIALPVVAVLTVAFFMGKLDNTESAKYTVLREADADWWSVPKGGVRG